MALSDKTQRGNNKRKRKYNLDTDILDFCSEEGIPTADPGLYVLDAINDIGMTLDGMHNCRGIKTIRDILKVTKKEFCFYLSEYRPHGVHYIDNRWKWLKDILKYQGFKKDKGWA